MQMRLRVLWRSCWQNLKLFRRVIHGTQQTLPKAKTRRKGTLYETLEVPPTATQTDIKEAYYELSLRYHPDRNNTREAREIFAEITKAYAILRNIDTRRQYDKDTGTYYIMRSSPKKGSGQKVLRLTDDALEIDMYKIDEATVYLKTIISLSVILGQPVRLDNIQTHKRPHGVQAWDMRMLRLLRQVCNGTLAANIGQTSVTFLPAELQSGSFIAEAGRPGIMSVLIEGALPCLPFAPIPQYSRHNTLDLKGTTHSLKGLHIDYINNVYRHVIGKFGFDINCEIRKRSYTPYWEGKVLVHTSPVDYLKSINLTNWGSLSRVSGWAFVSGPKPIRVAQVMAEKTKTRLKQLCPKIPIDLGSVRDLDSRSEGTGQGVLILGETTTGCVIGGTALWKRGMVGEEVVEKAVRTFEDNLSCEACVDHLMQDQMILLMALADGTSAVRVGSVDRRTQAAMKAVQAMTEVKYLVSRDSDPSSRKKKQSFIIECQGLGVTNSSLQSENSETRVTSERARSD